MNCNLCPRKCNAKRTADCNIGGFCKSPENVVISRADLHFWEEPSISGKNGSGTVFFSGCSLGCVYCQNFEISHKISGKTVSITQLAEIFKNLEEKGAHNINFVTPEHYIPKIKEALEIYRPDIPIVLNSSGYINENQMEILKDYIDIYLLDFKYMSGNRAKKYSFAEDYPEIAKGALDFAYRSQSECVFDSNGLMKKGVIVRHMLMPLATNEAISVFDYVTENYPNAYFSMMSQYLPHGKAEKYPEINRRVTKREYEKVVNHILESGFENCYIQERTSADDKYIPDFR